MSSTEKVVYEAFKEAMSNELTNYQEPLRKAVTEGPEGYRERVEGQEDNAEIVEKRI